MSFVPLLQASSTGQFSSLIVTMVLMIAIFYFFLIRPQSKKQKETQRMLDALKKGDKVITIGGIHGVVSSTKENTVVLKVDDNTKLEFNRSAVASVVKTEAQKAAEEKAAKEAKPSKGLFGLKKESKDEKTTDKATSIEETKDDKEGSK